MAGNAANLIVSVKTEVQSTNLDNLMSRLQTYAAKDYKIKVTADVSGLQNAIEQLKIINTQISTINKKHLGLNAFGGAKGGKSAKQEDPTKNINKQLKAVQSLDKQIQKSQKTLSDARMSGFDQTSKAYLGMEKAISRMEHARGELAKNPGNADAAKRFEAAAISASGYETKIRNVINVNKELAKSQRELEREQQKVPKTFEKGSTDYLKAYNKLYDLQRRQAEGMRWTAAKNGKSAGAFAEWDEQGPKIQELIQDFSKGGMALDEFNERYLKISNTMKSSEAIMESAGERTQSFGDKLRGVYTNLSRYITPAMIFMKSVQTIKQMVQASMEVESAMARIQIITGATKSQMGQFFSVASSQATELGKSITDVAGSIETFARLGYTLGESAELSKFATIMSNVGDVSVDEATTGITSIIKGYQLESDQAEHVSDVLIKVGQEYAISASELMEAFTRGGAALHASGTTFEQSAALFAATNASLQNAATTGTLWKTVSARIRNSKTELEELGESTDDLAEGFSKYRDELLALTGFDIQDATGNYKNLYDIFVGLAQVWDNINGDPAKARVAEILGGTRQLSGIMSTITNIRDAMDAYAGAMDSAGTAAQANSIYMETTAAHVEQFKAAFQELSYDFVNGNLLKGFVDFGTGTVKALDGVIDSVGSLSAGLAALSAIEFFKGAKAVGGLKSLSDLGAFLSGGSILGPLSAITAGVSVVTGIYNMYQNYKEAQRQSALSGADEFAERNKELSDYIDRISELRESLANGTLSESEAYAAKKELLEIQNQLNESYGEGAENLNLLNGSTEQQIEQLKELERLNANEFLNENKKGVDEAVKQMEKTRSYELGNFIDDGSKEARAIKDIVDQYKDFISITPPDRDGISQILFTGNVEDASRVLNEYMTTVRNSKELSEDRKVGMLEWANSQLTSANEVLATYEQIYKKYKEAELTSDETLYGYTDPKSGQQRKQEAIEWINDYRKAIEEYNDAIASGDQTKIAEARNNFEYIDAAIQTFLKRSPTFQQYSDFIAELSAQLQETAIAQDTLKESIISSSKGEDTALSKPLKSLKDMNMSYSEFLNKYQDIESGASSGRGKAGQAISELASAAKDAGIDIEVLGQILVDTGYLAADAASEIEEAAFSLDTFSEYQSTLESAFKSSKTATGLTTEEIEKLTEAYETLNDNGEKIFDPTRLFETTMNGIHLNREELKNLNDEMEHNSLKALGHDLEDLENQLKLASEAGDDTASILDKINETKFKISQFEGLTSAYKAWQDAQSAGGESDIYESIGSGYEAMKDILDRGWYGNEALQSYIDLMVNAKQQTGDVVADFAKIDQKIEGTDHSLRDYFTYDEKGKQTTDGLYDFLDDVNKIMGSEYAWQNEDGTYGFNFDGFVDGSEEGLTRLQALADAFGTTTELVQSFERALIEAGMKVNLDNLRNMESGGKFQEWQQEGKITETVDFSYDSSSMTPDEIQAKIDEIDGLRAQIEANVDASEAESTLNSLDTEIARLQNEKVRAKVRVEVEKSGKSIEELLAIEDDAELAAALHIDTSEVDVARQELESLSNADASVTVKIDESQFSQLTGLTEEKTVSVVYEITEQPDEPIYEDQRPHITYSMTKPPVPYYPNMSRTITYTLKVIGSFGGFGGGAFGTMNSIGRAMADGSMVNAPFNWKRISNNGKIALDRDEVALTNELGTESIIRNGQWMMLPGGMHMEALKKGDIVLSAEQTDALLRTGKANGHGKAYVNGTLLSNAYDSGSGGRRRVNSVPSTTSISTGGTRGSSGKQSSHETSKKDEDAEPEIIDWIEIAIDRLERVIKNLGIVAESTFKTLATRIAHTNDEIVQIGNEIELQAKAYNRYIEEANSVGLKDDLAKLVREGKVDIQEYDKETQELIEDYQEWYLVNAPIYSNVYGFSI